MPIAPTLVFDLDGTLADTAGDLIGALNVVLAREGVAPLPLASARSLLGAGGRALIARGFAHAGRDLAPAKLTAIVRRLPRPLQRAYRRRELRSFPGVEAVPRRAAPRRAGGSRCAPTSWSSPRICCSASSGSPTASPSSAGRTRSASPSPIRRRSWRRSAASAATPGGRRWSAIRAPTSRPRARAGDAVVAVDFGYTDVPVAELQPDRVISHFDAMDCVDARRPMGQRRRRTRAARRYFARLDLGNAPALNEASRPQGRLAQR